MQNLRTHHFNDGDVITGLCPNGDFGAYLERHDGRVRGYGHTRFAAIADLVEAIDHQEPEDFDHRAAQFDHDRKLRVEA